MATLNCASAFAQERVKLERSIPLPGVKGRMDHLTLDATGTRLWIAALENNTVEAIDLSAGTRIKSIDSIKEPQGVCLSPQSNRVIVASGEDGMLRAFDDAFKLVASLKGLDDADNVRFDAGEKRVYVGFGAGAIGVIDADKFTKLAEIKLDAHPESFQLEQKGRRIFVNVPKAGQIAVIDRDKRAVIATWPVTEAKANYPMALDEEHKRLFVVCRKPARILVLDSDSGKGVATLECCGDGDDLFYDSARKLLYVSGGEGCISVFEQKDADHYQLTHRIATVAGARTSLFVPETSRLYLAVPHGADHEAEIREYSIQP
ncbi:MAG: hypothetical protein HY287_00540 [Planctomycetes bacterium]|nr:hypothetical protein [Planctomycetota bacterium]MBI3832800.1 hypothetical protein [Planctomycetota bacterium]